MEGPKPQIAGSGFTMATLTFITQAYRRDCIKLNSHANEKWIVSALVGICICSRTPAISSSLSPTVWLEEFRA